MLSFLGVLGVVFASLIAVPAHADDAAGNPIVFDTVSFEKTEFEDGTRQEVSVQWHVDGNPTEAPISIELPLPSWLQGEADFFTLRGDGGEDIGSCTITATAATCEITDDAYVSERPLDFRGHFSFYLVSERGNTASETIDETIGGHDFTFTVAPRQDNGGGVCDDCEYVPAQPEKFGQYLRATEPGQVDRIRWVVRVGDVPAGTQPGDLAAMGAPIAEGRVIEVTDSGIDDGMTVVSVRVIGADTVRKGPDGNEVLNFEDVPESELDWSDDFTTVSWTAAPAESGDLGQNPAGEDLRGLGGTVYEVEWTVTLDDEGAAGAYYNTASFTVDGRSTGNMSAVSQRGGGSGGAVGVNEGQLLITKTVEGDASFDPAPEFSVTVDAYDADGTKFDSESATISDGESFLTKTYRVGTRLVVTETVPAAPSNIDWSAAIEDEASGGSSQGFSYEVVLSPENRNVGRVSTIALTNTATLQMGAFSATKTVVNDDGLALDDDARYLLDYEWDADASRGFAAGAGTIELVADGAPVASGSIPVGAVVRVSERASASVDGGQWQAPVITPAEFTVTADTASQVTVRVTNELIRVYGALSVAKTLSGSGADLVADDQEFTVHYSFPAVNGHPGGSGEIQVQADGTPVVVGDLPSGAVVTLTEDAPAAVDGARWTAAVFSTSEVTIVGGEIAAVTLENTIDELPAEGGVDTPEIVPGLAVTGGALLPGAMALAALLVGAGVVLLVRRRRQEA
ncbi:DUF5979 domain-containing protein [Microbacterium sp. NPDC058342]|uniref:DUF5979 domain-containing protein n=1 Tax=Microbacterium sp. NPDC058342 TaxID=3346454 RepID=UPI00364F42CB